MPSRILKTSLIVFVLVCIGSAEAHRNTKEFKRGQQLSDCRTAMAAQCIDSRCDNNAAKDCVTTCHYKSKRECTSARILRNYDY